MRQAVAACESLHIKENAAARAAHKKGEKRRINQCGIENTDVKPPID
jgi:hypothetical protein